MNVVIKRSTNPKKKFQAHLNGKTIRFGDSNYQDFTQHGDVLRKQRYIQRHQKNEDWSDMSTAGFWSKHLLWNKPSLTASVKDLNQKISDVQFVLA